MYWNPILIWTGSSRSSWKVELEISFFEHRPFWDLCISEESSPKFVWNAFYGKTAQISICSKNKLISIFSGLFKNTLIFVYLSTHVENVHLAWGLRQPTPLIWSTQVHFQLLILTSCQYRPQEAPRMMAQIMSSCHLCGRPGISFWLPALAPTVVDIWVS